MNTLRNKQRVVASTSQIAPLPPLQTRSAPTSPSHRPLQPSAAAHSHNPVDNPSRGISTLTAASQFTSIIQYAKAGSQKDLLASQHALVELQQDQLALDTARFEFEKQKHAEIMELKRDHLKVQQRLMKMKEGRSGLWRSRLKQLKLKRGKA